MPKRSSKSSSGKTKVRGRGGGLATKRLKTGIQKPVEPDEALAQIVGAKPQPRTEMIKRIWNYIKSHKLQDPKDRRVIRPDGALSRVLGDKRRVSMFEIAGFLNSHLAPA
jgi:upstream activation factor subunit UAF30